MKKKASDFKNSAANLQKELEKQNTRFKKDERFWTVTQNKEGSGSAVIRFLPAKDGENFRFVTTYGHGWKNRQGRWFIEECPITIHKDCPICVDIDPYWDGDDGLVKIAKERKKKKGYIANIYVVKDKAHPENEGKIFLFKFGEKIMAKIIERLEPDDDDVEPVDVTNLWAGCDFTIKVKKVSGFNNYDSSSFAQKPSVLGNLDDDELDKIWQTEHSLLEFLEESRFKEYNVLERAYRAFIGKESAKAVTVADDDEDEEEIVEPTHKRSAKKKPAVKPPFDVDEDEEEEEEEEVEETEPADDDDDAEGSTGGDGEDEDDEAYYKKLLNKRKK